MNLQEEIEKVEKKAENLEKQSLAFSIYKEYKKTNFRLFIIVLLLMAYAAFMTYKYIDLIENYGVETVTEIADTEGEGNACVGENCNNGVVYGEGS